MDDAAEAVKIALLENPSGDLSEFLFLIGPGNNGADGWLTLAKLRRALEGRHPQSQTPIWVYCPQEGSSEIWQKQKARAEAAGFDTLTSEQLMHRDWHQGCIVDAVFGTGLKRDVPEAWQKIFRRLRRAQAWSVAVDLPSGLDADRGIARGTAFRAKTTVTFGTAKPGLLLMEGPGLAGKIRIAPLRFPRELVRDIAITHSAFGRRSAELSLPYRPLAGHKGSFGHVVLLCGSAQYRGAGILAGEAALRVGTGYVHIAADRDVYPDIMRLPEALYFEPESFFATQWDFATAVFVVGPGLSQPDFLRRALQFLHANRARKVILDAEAFHHLSILPRPLPATWILTPHPGELARMTGMGPQSINDDRCAAALAAERAWGATILLKGFRTVVASHEHVAITLAGNSALAKAGSGDVLAGLLAGLYVQMESASTAASLASYVHGRIASLHVYRGGDPASLIPSDLIQAIDPTFVDLRQKRRARVNGRSLG